MNEQERAANVQQAAAGDADALQRLIVHYHATLHGKVAAALDTHLRGRIEPDDILQQAYITAFKNIADCHFDGPGGFYKWLEAIVLNQLKDVQRALRRQKRDIGREVHSRPDATASYPGLISRLASTESTPSRRVARDEAIAGVMTCLARLSEDQRAVVRLRYLECLPVADVAARLGRPEETIHTLCSRGLRRLRELLGPITGYLTRG